MSPLTSKFADAYAQPRVLPWPHVSLRAIVAFLLRLDAVARQRRDLSQLDDRMLQDIGVTRADVEREMARPLSW
jgi:uncharacterized protein YjiS (DUF1127 family)